MTVKAAKLEKAPAKGKKARPLAAPQAIPHHDERVATALARNALARERFQFLLRTLFVLFGLLFISMAANIYFGMQTTQYRYFAVDPEGSITEVVPLERPIQSTVEVLNWSTDAIIQSFTLSFANYGQQLSDIRHLFTDSGWEGFEQALTRNRILQTVTSQQLVTTAVPAGAPVIITQGVSDTGRYGWRIQMPVVITYESASGRNSQNLTVDAVIVRRPESENPRGLGIGQIIAR